MIKKVNILVLAALVLGVAYACKKKTDDPPPAANPAPQRDEISYWLTVNPRAENKTNSNPLYKDTLIIKLNGTTLLSSLGSVAEAHGPYKIKSSDKLFVRYNPGKVVTTKGEVIFDENSLMLSLDYNGSDNMTLREYGCRCVTHETITIP